MRTFLRWQSRSAILLLLYSLLKHFLVFLPPCFAVRHVVLGLETDCLRSSVTSN